LRRFRVLVYLIYLVFLVCLVYLVRGDSLFEPDQPNKLNEPTNQLKIAELPFEKFTGRPHVVRNVGL